MAERFNVPAAPHVYHGDLPEMVDVCLEAGYTSVMLDYSLRPFQEFAEAMQRVVAKAHPRGITVEGEIGTLGKVDDAAVEGRDTTTLTDRNRAARFIKAILTIAQEIPRAVI